MRTDTTTSRAQRVAICVLIVGVAVLGASGASSATKPSASVELDAADLVAAATLSRAYGVGEPEAKERLVRENAYSTFITSFVTKLGVAEWGGAWIDERDDGRLVLQVRNVRNAELALDSAVPAFSAGFVRLNEVRWSLEQLDAFAIELESDMTRANISYEWLDISQRHNSIVLTVAEDSVSSARTFLDTRLSGPPISISPVNGHYRPFACTAAFQLCDPPLRGSVEMLNTATGSVCSAGFVVESVSDAKPYLLTAGHCFTDTTNIACASSGTWQTVFTDLGALHSIGQRWSCSYSSTQDEGIITVTNPAGWGLPTTSKVFVQTSGGSSATVRDENYYITAAANPLALPDFSWLCWSGAAKHTECAQKVGGSGNFTTLAVMDSQGGPCQGDSGGPVFKSHTGYGMISGGISPFTQEYLAMYFVPYSQHICSGVGAPFRIANLPNALNVLHVQLM